MAAPHLPWTGSELAPRRPEEFSFVLLSDRTALARPGVFERAVEITNLLRPDFVVQVGDTIEGYTEDPIELARQWAEFDAITAGLQVPLFRVPGNHDVSNVMMREEWLRRHGALHYHFRHQDVLFLILDTQDPPQRLAEFLTRREQGSGPAGSAPAEMEELFVADPAGAAARLESLTDWEGTMPAHIGAEQTAWAERVIAENADVRWTVIAMHIPAWQGDSHPGYDRIRRAIGARPFTTFAGHVHNYRRTVLDGRDHIRLGPTGGTWVLSGDEGNFDHLAWATMTGEGLQVANIVLDGVIGIEGGEFRPAGRYDLMPR